MSPALERAGIDPAELSEHITELIYEQIFEHGFFHGDPHPGNMLVLPGGVTGLLDYGMMGSFSPPFRSSIAYLIAGLAEKNHQEVMGSILEMSEEGFASNPGKMLADVEAFSEQHLNQPLRDIKLGDVLNKLLEMLRNNHLRMKGSFYLGVKALTQVEAIGRSLNPDLNFLKLGEPYAMRQIEGKYHPARIFALARKLFGESLDFLEDFPHDFRQLYQRVKHGKINIPLQHKIDPEGFEPLRKTLDSIANRLTNAILAASVLICSSILVLSGVPPEIGRRFDHWRGRAHLGNVHVPSARPFHLETRRTVATLTRAGGYPSVEGNAPLLEVGRGRDILCLMDSFGRVIDYLRISVTDRCNERCLYCMPEGYKGWAQKADHLTASEIVRVAGAACRLGFRKFRLTGGEPCIRKDLVQIAAGISMQRGVRIAWSVHQRHTFRPAGRGRCARRASIR